MANLDTRPRSTRRTDVTVSRAPRGHLEAPCHVVAAQQCQTQCESGSLFRVTLTQPRDPNPGRGGRGEGGRAGRARGRDAPLARVRGARGSPGPAFSLTRDPEGFDVQEAAPHASRCAGVARARRSGGCFFPRTSPTRRLLRPHLRRPSTRVSDFKK